MDYSEILSTAVTGGIGGGLGGAAIYLLKLKSERARIIAMLIAVGGCFGIASQF